MSLIELILPGKLASLPEYCPKEAGSDVVCAGFWVLGKGVGPKP